MKSTKCPCNGCICVPVCRFKPYHKMYWDCYLIRTYLLNSFEDSRFNTISDTLKPTRWNVAGSTVVYRRSHDC